MKTKELIYQMLTESTGAHICDSGGIYGRHWERNQKKSIQDFENEPEEEYILHKNGKWMDRRVSVFHYLSGLELDDLCDQFNSMPCEDWDSEHCGISKAQQEFLEDNHEIVWGRVFNTYNGDSDLSQILQGEWLEIFGEQYLLLQIHQGCDARGGYTNAKLFKTREDCLIHEYLQEYEDEYEFRDRLEYDDIVAVDYEDTSITYSSDEISSILYGEEEDSETPDKN